MRRTRIACMLIVHAVLSAGFVCAQSQNRAAPPADLAQLMRGIMFPSSNVFFAAQDQNPDEIKPDSKPAVSPNPLTSVFGKWQAVENSALALAESASLMMIPGRKCSNGADVPLKNPDWAKLVQEFREAGLTAYKAAQSKNQDNVLSAAEVVTNSCSNCHRKYRERPNRADQCR